MQVSEMFEETSRHRGPSRGPEDKFTVSELESVQDFRREAGRHGLQMGLCCPSGTSNDRTPVGLSGRMRATTGTSAIFKPVRFIQNSEWAAFGPIFSVREMSPFFLVWTLLGGQKKT